MKHTYNKATKTIVIIGYNNAQILDITGPGQVFASANDLSGKQLYNLVIGSMDQDAIKSDSQITLRATPLSKIPHAQIDTVIIAGGNKKAIKEAVKNSDGLNWIIKAERFVQRVSSVCTGAFLFAETGLLTNKKVTTHWKGASKLKEQYPDINVCSDKIYIKDGKYWTSAGATSGIDMALAMVQEDFGRALSMQIAQELVVYHHRSGSQAQFSSMLKMQTKSPSKIAELIDWIEDNLQKNLTIETIAKKSGMSVRTLHRKFHHATGSTPAKYIEQRKVNVVRNFLQNSNDPLKVIANKSGFTSELQLIRAFQKTFGLTPTSYRSLHSIKKKLD